jgi:hypothetical protein
MTIPDLVAIKARLAAATPGPWKFDEQVKNPRHLNDGRGWPIVTAEEYAGASWFEFENPNDKLFIAHAREDIPALLSLVEQQKAEIERMRPLYELYTVKPAQTASAA